LPISVAFCLQSLFTGSIVVIYSEADFEVFRPAGATRCTDGGETWHGGALLRAKFHHHRCNDKGIGPPKLKFLLRFYQNVEHKRPEICRVCTPFKDVLAVKILLKGLWSYGDFKLTGSGYLQIFSAPYQQNYASDPQKF